MNDRIVLPGPNRFDNIMMMHEQGKLLPNESLYPIDGRFTFDDGTMEELMNGGSEQLNDFPHMESALGKQPNFMTNPGPTSLISSMNEEYYNQFPFSQIMMSNSHGSSVNGAMGSLGSGAIGGHGHAGAHYSYHTLQPSQSGAGGGQHHLIGSVNPASYAQIGNGGASGASVYAPKLGASATRTPPYTVVNSAASNSPGGSSSSSNSSSSSSGSLGNQAASGGHSGSGEGHDYDANSQSGAVPNPSDPAEIIRQKQLRGMKLTQEEIQLLVKDRQRKDNHNMIERKRRFNINDRIKELGDMLPKNGDYDTKQNKGSILKGSVDYMNKLKSECDEARKIQEAYKQVLSLNKKLVTRIKEYEALCKANGLALLGQVGNNGSLGPNGLANNPNNLVNPYLSHQPISYHHDPGSLINASSNMSGLTMNGYSNFAGHNLNESPLMIIDHANSNNHLPPSFANNPSNFNPNKNAYLNEPYQQPLNGPGNASYINENGTFSNSSGVANGGVLAQQSNPAGPNGASLMRNKPRKRPANGSAKSDGSGRDGGSVDADLADEKAEGSVGKPDEKKPKEEPTSPRSKQLAEAAAGETEKKSVEEASVNEASAAGSKGAAEDKESKTDEPPAENLYVESESGLSVVKLVTPAEPEQQAKPASDEDKQEPSQNVEAPSEPQSSQKADAGGQASTEQP